MKRQTGYLSLSLFEKIISMFPSKQKLVRLHHFGEAVLHPEIDTMIKMVGQAGLFSVISLNPATLSKDMCRKIVDASPSLICFSFDTFTDEGLQKIRGIKKSFNYCMAMLDLCIDMSRKTSNTILKVIQTVALDANKCDLTLLEEMKKNYEASDLIFYNAENTGFGDLDLVEETRCGGSVQLLKDAKPCAAPFYEVSILWNGDVVLCCYDYDGFNVLGNINTHSLAQIWKGEKIKKIRQIFLENSTQKLPLCCRCYLAPHNFSSKALLSEKNWKEESLLLQLIETAHQKNEK